MKILMVAGIRPNFVKASVVLPELEKEGHECGIVHSGQHYDKELSDFFFRDLKLPNTIADLDVGSGSHAFQVGRTMEKLESVYEQEEPDLVMVLGDANVTLAGALSAIKMHIPVAHIEAGYRSNDWFMPEEINRILVDHCSLLLYASTYNARRNLVREGIPQERIYVVGSTIANAVLQSIDVAEKQSKVLSRFNLEDKRYGVLTCHRPRNVDNKKNLSNIIAATKELNQFSFIFPIHPRTVKKIAEFDLDLPSNLIPCEPLGYFDFLKLINHSRLVLTDSGSLSEECLTLRVPCVTLRRNTERLITIESGGNSLVGNSKQRIVNIVRKIWRHPSEIQTTQTPPLWDLEVGKRIAETIHKVELPYENMLR